MNQLLFKTFGLDQSKVKFADLLDVDFKISGALFETFDIMEI